MHSTECSAPEGVGPASRRRRLMGLLCLHRTTQATGSSCCAVCALFFVYIKILFSAFGPLCADGANLPTFKRAAGPMGQLFGAGVHITSDGVCRTRKECMKIVWKG